VEDFFRHHKAGLVLYIQFCQERGTLFTATPTPADDLQLTAWMKARNLSPSARKKTRSARNVLQALITNENYASRTFRALMESGEALPNVFRVRGDEYEILRNHLQGMPSANLKEKRARAIMAFLLDTASRVGDIQAVATQSVQRATGGEISFQFNNNPTEEAHKSTTKETAIARRRNHANMAGRSAVFHLSDWASDIVRDYLGRVLPTLSITPESTGIFFGLSQKTINKPIGTETLQKIVQAEIDKTSLGDRTPRVTPHKTKYITCSQWRKLGMHIDGISERSRTTIETLRTFYTFYVTDTKRADKLNLYNSHQEDSSAPLAEAVTGV